MRRTVVGCLGYRNLRDLSFGPHLLEALERLTWPEGVELHDFGPGGPIAAVHKLRETPVDRVLIACAVERGRPPGDLRALRWDGAVAADDLVQAAIAEGVTGVISLDNLVTVGGYFGIWPAELLLLELEPVETEWGPALGADAAARLPIAVETVKALVFGDDVSALPRCEVRPSSATGLSGWAPTRLGMERP